MTDTGQINLLSEMGADYAGLIFYKKSPRFCGDRVQPEQLEEIRNKIKLTGVFVNENIEEIKRKISQFSLSAVQLCGTETPDECRELKNHAEVLKVIHVGDEGINSIALNEYSDTADFLLFDTKTEKYGGSGDKFPWKILGQSGIGKSFFLSGGIEADDSGEIGRFHHPFLYGVDINSRFETVPGVKDMQKVKKFISQLKSE